MESTFTAPRFLAGISHSLLIVVTAIVALAANGTVATTQAQATTQTTSEPRQNPAPWRPSFGPLNQDTANPATVQASNRDKSGPPPGNAVNLGAAQAGEAASQAAAAPGVQAGPPTETRPQAFTPTTQADGSIEPGITRVSKTLDKLPNSAGQIWREYDISPYTSRITTSTDPQKAITQWILRETGNEMWFHEPLGILSAEKDRLLVYHTPEIHNIVKSIVDRFNRTRGQIQDIDINLVTVENPNWRSQSYTMLQPIEVKSPGVEAWMVSKENAAILMSQLRRRGDFKQHSSGRASNHDGQSIVLEKTRPVQFVRNIRWVPNQVPNYQPQLTSLDEGYRLELGCLSSLDNTSIEAVIKCNVDQVEKLSNVRVNLPAPGGGAQQMNLQIPQVVSWRLHERFRWPNDQVLVLSCGVVATPEPDNGGGLRIPGLTQRSKRADALLFVEYRGPAAGPMVPQTADNRLAPIRTQK